LVSRTASVRTAPAADVGGGSGAGASSGAAPATKRARVWWLVHQWAGLKFSVLLSFVLFTGTLAVFSTEMDWAMRPAMRVDMASVSGPVDFPAVAREAARARPDWRIQSIEAPPARAFAAIVTARRPDGAFAFLYAHPTTGKIQGEGHWVGAKRVLRNMHRHLNMPIWLGVPIVSSLALLLLVSLVTSLVVYKKWWRGYDRPIRTRDARTGLGDFHRLAGVWSLWFVALMILTGLWYLAEEVAAGAPPAPRPLAAGSPAASASALAAAPLPASALADRLAVGLAAARVADPQIRFERVLFPTDRLAAFKFEGQKAAILVRPRANAVWTDARTGAPLLVADARDMNAHQRIAEAADPLHFGTFGGYWTKTIWFLFGLLLTGLSVSGVMLYAMRIGRSKRLRGEGRGIVLRVWQGMGAWRWPATALVVTGFALLPTLFSAGE
jgi:uncharacterized iron-regulated membrane protein